MRMVCSNKYFILLLILAIVTWLKEKTDPNYKPAPEHVVTLTTETFDEFIGDKPLVLVEFYAPCK